MTTIYSSSVGDGSVWNNNADFAACRSASAGNAVQMGGFGNVMACLLTGQPNIRRLYTPIDTSGLPDNATITAASYFICYYLGDKIADTLVPILTTQPDPTTLTTSDYSALTLNSPAEGASRVALNAFTDGTYYEFVLNATGISWINKTGYTKIGLRNATRDIDNNGTLPDSQYALFYLSDSAYKPYLSITYSLPPEPPKYKAKIVNAKIVSMKV